MGLGADFCAFSFSTNHIVLGKESMNRKKLVAIITGAISVAIAVAYLILVQFLDFRGEMIPAPVVDLIFPFQS